MLVPGQGSASSALSSVLSRFLRTHSATHATHDALIRGAAVLRTGTTSATVLGAVTQSATALGHKRQSAPQNTTDKRGAPVIRTHTAGVAVLRTENLRAPVLGSRRLRGRRFLKSHRGLRPEACSFSKPSDFCSFREEILVWNREFHSLPASGGTMGGQQSKNRTGSVQGLNFSPRQEAQGSFSSSAVDRMAPIEAVACKVDELSDGEMKEVQIGEASVLLVKEKGKFYAVGNKCSHYGAPLSKGAYCNGVVRCPWHGACFNVKTGDIEDFPGLDSLPRFDVDVRGADVFIKADPDILKNAKRVKPMCKADASNKQTFVLVGGGAATVACAETLRQEGFTGRIVVLTKETSLPYDRPKLSKAMTSTAESIALRNQDFFKSCDIEFRTGTEVTGVDTSKKEVLTANGPLPYDALLLATGGKPRTMPIPGMELENVCVLRTPDDANRIAANSEGKNVVIIGSSFIGLEAAVYLHNTAQSVTVVGRGKVPLDHVFGSQIGAAIAKLHESKGVKFHFECGIKEFRGQDGKLKQAVLSDDTVLEADLCVLGIGVVPATDFLKDSGLELSPPGFVTVDKQMKTNQAGVFAAGDIVKFPLFINENQPSNIQHWQMAHKHGRVAALNMLGKNVDVHSVPYFWTVMYGKSIRYTGYGPGYDDIVVHGDVDALQFAAFYTKGDRVVAVASLQFDPIVSQAASLMERGEVILKSEIMDDPRSWVGRLKQNS